MADMRICPVCSILYRVCRRDYCSNCNNRAEVDGVPVFASDNMLFSEVYV